MKAEDKLRSRAIRNGPEAFSRDRIAEANELIHEERYRDCSLVVHGGLGSFSVGTSARLSRDDGAVFHTFGVSSWVYDGKDAAIESARAWARRILDEPSGDVPLETEPFIGGFL